MLAIKLFLSTFFFCICIDMLWLAVIAKNFYDSQIGSILRKTGNALTPNWGGAIMVYILITLGIMLFVIPKTQDSYKMAIFYGGLFGLVTYGIYDFTNYSILAKWPLTITIVDLCWGIFLCSTTACFSLLIKKWLTV